jgi:hypothetical protein
MVRAAFLAAFALLAAAGAARADGEDAPVATSHGPGWVDQDVQDKDVKPARVAPAPDAAPMADLSALHGVRDESFFGNLHGQAGVMIGSNNTRAAWGEVHGPIGENADFALSFSTVHSDGMPYYGYGYYGFPPGYGRFQGTSYSLGAAYTLRPNRDRSPFYWDPAAADAGWPGYGPYRGEVTTDVTDDPAG